MATEVLTSETDHSGRTVGNWRLLRPLGIGGFGAVYEAEHLTIPGRLGAVKILHAHMAQNADIKRRFINEASAASRADHENIVQIFDGGVTEDGLCYVVMELLTGQSLAALLRRGPLSADRTSNIGAQVAAALSAAHGLGIVHRDLKPDNIFLVHRDTNPEFVKVLDFGIAKLEDGGGKTQTGMWLGTPPFMAPEQWQTLPDIDGRADLYALGIILYQCLTGALPFAASTPFGWLTAHLQHPVPEPSAYEGPAELLGLVRRLLAKQREDRPQLAADVARELRRAGGGQDTPPVPIATVINAAPPSAAGAAPTARRWRQGVVALFLGLAAVLLGAGRWYLGTHRDGGPAAATATPAADLAEARERPALPTAEAPSAPDGGLAEAPPDLAPVAAPVLASPKDGGSRKRAASKRRPASKEAGAPPSAASPPAPVPAAEPKKPGPEAGQERRKHEPIY